MLQFASCSLSERLLIGAWRSLFSWRCILGTGDGICWGLLDPAVFLNDWQKRMKAKRRGGLDSSNPFCWVSMATGSDCMCIALNKWRNLGLHCTRTHTLAHNPANLFALVFFKKLYLLSPPQFNSFHDIHTLLLRHRVSWTTVHAKALVPSLYLSLAYTWSLINISHFLDSQTTLRSAHCFALRRLRSHPYTDSIFCLLDLDANVTLIRAAAMM